jgi:conjugative relaxase-like TrwC/TraI family protein
MRMMGRDSVAYHDSNVADRADDFAAATLAYYGSRGETPLVWGGSGAPLLGVDGVATADTYRAVFAPGGARLPRTDAPLVSTRRPGLELVVSPHKSVAELGVVGRADDMHAIVDAERDATMAYLDRMVRGIGGRRGERARATRTGGLTWATSRHATTRAGDPQVHDHVLVANVVWMRDERGGWKALDTAFVRDQLHAATATGRMAAARVAVELGYAITADDGPSGRLGGWRIAGIPDAALAVHAKRSAQIDARVSPGASYRSRNVAALFDREPKRHEPVADLVTRWRAELTDAGYPPRAMLASIATAARRRPPPADRLGDEALAALVARALGPESRLSAVKVFDRAEVIVAVAPQLHGLPLGELDRAVDAVLAHPDCIPLLGVAGARTQAYATAAVLAAEEEIAALAVELAGQTAPAVDAGAAETAVEAVEGRLGVPMTAGQHDAAVGLLGSGAGLDLVVGVAGSGKTTALAAVAAGFEAAGFMVIGTATSGHAARGLGEGAGLDESRTIASLVWRLDHDRIRLTDRHVLIVDEAGMTDDPDLGRLLAAVRTARAKLVVVGDDRQLGAVGPGGGLGALLRRHPERVWQLTDNVRQADVSERDALAELRAGKVEHAVAWYQANDRIRVAPSPDETVAAMVGAWAIDVAAGVDTTMVAWRHASVDALNEEAREAYAALGRLSGPEIEAPGGRRYRAGDRMLMLTPGPGGAWVTSERATVVVVHPRDGSLAAVTPEGRWLRLERDATAADRLTHAYAVTAHRSQGSTVTTAHVLEDGGGRELAYVTMSRARHTTHVYLTAPDAEEAAKRLGWAWGAERRPVWAHDQGQPVLSAAERARLVSDRHILTRTIPAENDRQLVYALDDLKRLDADLAHLAAGTGRWAGRVEGAAARALIEARAAHDQASRRATQPGAGILDRRRVARTARALDAARHAWDTHCQPEADRLEAQRPELQARIAVLSDPTTAYADYLERHPKIATLIRDLDQRIGSPAVIDRDLPPSISPPVPSPDNAIDIGL